MGTNYESFFIAATSAEGYCRTAEIIRPYAKNCIDIDSLIKFSGAYVINMAFACELYLKALLLYWYKDIPKSAKEGHDLKALYDKLELCDKQVVESQYLQIFDEKLKLYDKKGVELRYNKKFTVADFLEDECRIFVTHRYPYEKNQPKEPIYYEPFEAFMESLAYACVNRQKQSGVTDHAD